MKKVLAVIPGVLAAFHAVIPLCFLIAFLSGRYLQLGSPLFLAILLSALTLVSFIVMLAFRAEYGWANSVALSLSLLFSAVTQFYYIFHAIKVYEGYDTTVPAFVFAVDTITMIVLFIKIVDDSWYKAAFAVVTVLFSMAAIAYAGYALVSGTLFGEKYYTDGPSSPNGDYRTYITYRESGLTSDGGSYVYTVRTKECGVPFGTLKYAPKRIYEGNRLAYDHMIIKWVDSGETLLIDGEIYRADKSPEENKAEESSEPAYEFSQEQSGVYSEPEESAVSEVDSSGLVNSSGTAEVSAEE